MPVPEGILARVNEDLGTNAVVAPAVLYEAGRPDIIAVNAKLFAAAQRVGDSLGLPTYTTVGLGRSVTPATSTTTAALNAATALSAEGWYYAFEFEEERIPSSSDAVFRCCVAGLALAITGTTSTPCLRGSNGSPVVRRRCDRCRCCHSQNLWKFSRERWEQNAGQGGGGADAPARFFSGALWGTIVLSVTAVIGRL